MIRAHRVNAVAQDDASLIAGWNISPNVAYTLRLLPGQASCGVLLFDAAGMILIATGAALVGTEQPCVLTQQSGQIIGMLDAELGWHLLVTTMGTESQREIRINPTVDLPDEIHPVYGDDGMGLARATAAIDEAAHYHDDVTISCPLGLGSTLGDVVSVVVDGTPVVGQVESIIWTATPDGSPEQVVIRRHVAIAPDVYVEPIPVTPPVVADDSGETDADTSTSGNVLTNDEAGLTVVAVNGISANVGVAVDGNNGGIFTISADGSWTFDPAGDFAMLEGSETAETSVTYYASDGTGEASATLTVTVSAVTCDLLWTPAEIPGAVWIDANTVTLDGSAVTTMTDKVGGTITAVQNTSAARPSLVTDALGSEDVIQFDGNDFLSFGTALGKPANWTIFAVAMFASMGPITHLCGSCESTGYSSTAWGSIAAGRTLGDGKLEYQFGDGVGYSYGRSTNPVVTVGNWFMVCRKYTSGQDRPADRVNGAATPVTRNEGPATSCAGTPYEYAIGRPGGYNGLYASNGSRLKGFVCVPSAISDADAEKLEGYYAHLCGLAALLPSGHPYKSTPPTI